MMYMHATHLDREYVPRRADASSIAPAALAAAVMIAGACGGAPQGGAEPAAPSPSSELAARIRRFAPVDVTADVGGLPLHERQALADLIRAARLMDGLFLEQVWAGNTSTLVRLAADRTPEGQARLHYFLINKGPWSRLDEGERFLDAADGIPDRPPAQANYYPADATRDEVERWMSSLGGTARTDATGFFTVIRRGADGRLMSVPYSVEYRNTLLLVSEHLRRAASRTTQPSLKRYLESRAASLLSNDYLPSDLAWMQLDASIEPTIGPYETYEDAWFGYKAAFEAFITLRDDVETGKLATFSGELQGLEDQLPIDAKYRSVKIGALAPIRVVNVVFTAGDANRGVQTAAFNLPNDDRIIRQHGSKRVMLKNIQQAKFDKVLTPIAAVALPATDRASVSFDAFFTHILMHELMHGLGPHVVAGSGDAVRIALKDTYAPIEEAKADISGLWALGVLADKGVVAPAVAQSMYRTFLASTFRSIRFGLKSAHGRGVALQLNSLIDQGALTVNADGTFAVVDERMREAVTSLTRDIMTVQAQGNYAGAQTLLSRAVVRPEVQRILDKLGDVPVDIEPMFVAAARVLEP
jgi:hypothetical protein